MSENKTISLNACPLLCEGIELKDLNLSPEEGFIISRLDGQVRVRHLVSMTGLGEEATLKIIKGLVERGVIILHEDKEKEEARKEKASKVSAGFRVDYSTIPKDDRFKDYVARLREVLDEIDYFQLLGLDHSANKEEVKKAYFRFSKIFHPDRYYRETDKEFKRHLIEIFRRINIAYQVLFDPEKRKEYEKEIKEKGILSAGEDLSLSVRKKSFSGPKLSLGLDKTREQIKEEKAKKMVEKLKKTGLGAHLEKARRIYNMALEEIKSKNFKSARTNIQLAIQLDPMNPVYKEELKRLEELEQSLKIELYYEDGERFEQSGDYRKALNSYLEALKLNPNEPRYLYKAANIMINHTGEFERGRGLLLRLLEVDNKKAEYYYLLGLAYKGLGQKRAAEVQFQKAVELDPKHKPATKELKALRR